ncbi:MAG: TolC family protein [Bacteroidales bacterium]|nr:TolC family protein [Candidatus Egerieousia equi]
MKYHNIIIYRALVAFVATMFLLCCRSYQASGQTGVKEAGEPSQVKEWSLDDCIEYALEHNTGIRRKELTRDAAQTEVSRAGWSYAPSVSLSTSGTSSTGRVLDQTTYQFIKNSTVTSTNSSLSAGMTVFGGFSKLYALKKARLLRKAANEDMEAARTVTKLDVTAAYLALLCSMSEAESARETYRLLEKQEERIAIMVEAGKVTESDLLQVRSQKHAAAGDIEDYDGETQKARLQLVQLMELDPGTELHIQHGDGIGVVDCDTADIFTHGLDTDLIVRNRPEWRSANLSAEAAEKNLSQARAAYYPSLSLSFGYGSSFSDARQKQIQNPDGTYSYEKYSFADQYRDNASTYISLGISIPIFSGMVARNNVRQARINLNDSRLALVETEKAIANEYIQARIDCRTALHKYQSAQKQLDYAVEAQRQLDEKYRLGATDFNSWNTAVTELSKARIALAQTRYTYVFRRRMLEMYRR